MRRLQSTTPEKELDQLLSPYFSVEGGETDLMACFNYPKKCFLLKLYTNQIAAANGIDQAKPGDGQVMLADNDTIILFWCWVENIDEVVILIVDLQKSEDYS